MVVVVGRQQRQLLGLIVVSTSSWGWVPVVEEDVDGVLEFIILRRCVVVRRVVIVSIKLLTSSLAASESVFFGIYPNIVVVMY